MKNKIDESELDIDLVAKFKEFSDLFTEPMAALAKHLDVPVKIKLIDVMNALSLHTYGENILAYLQDDTLVEDAEKYIAENETEEDGISEEDVKLSHEMNEGD